MKLQEDELIERYKKIGADDLWILYRSGDLSDVAMRLLWSELESRGIDPESYSNKDNEKGQGNLDIQNVALVNIIFYIGGLILSAVAWYGMYKYGYHIIEATGRKILGIIQWLFILVGMHCFYKIVTFSRALRGKVSIEEAEQYDPFEK